MKGFKFLCPQFLIAPVIHPTSVSPSWWRWWHCSCCLCIASRAWRRHLSGIPARPYPVEDGKADRTLLTALTDTALAQRGEDVSVSLYQQRENITQLFTERSGWFNPPTPGSTRCTGNLWCCSMRWNRAQLDAALAPFKQAEEQRPP